MPTSFDYDVFLSYSSKDKSIVQSVAERLKEDGLRVWMDSWEISPGDSIPSRINDGLENSRILILFISKNSLGSDWVGLESQTFRFRDPLNKERRFIPLRLDTVPLKSSLSQFSYIQWGKGNEEAAYATLLKSCIPRIDTQEKRSKANPSQFSEKALQLGSMDRIFAYSFSLDGEHCLTAQSGYTGNIRLWNVGTGALQASFQSGNKPLRTVLCLKWADDGKRFAASDSNGNICIWNIKTGKCDRIISAPYGHVTSVAWTEEPHLILAGTLDRVIRLWDTETGKCLRTFEGHTGGINTLIYNSRTRQILSGAKDHSARLWDFDTRQCLTVFKGHTDQVQCIGFSPDQKQVVSGSSDRTIRVWDVYSGQSLRVLEGHTATVKSISWSHNGHYILSGSLDSTVRLWSTRDGTYTLLKNRLRPCLEIVWNDSGQKAISGHDHGKIRIWNLEELLTHNTHSAPLRAQISSDQVQYTNAKVLVVGDTSAGKTSLANRLATGKWKPSDGSTVGAWSTQWSLPNAGTNQGIEQEIWLWDFGGQADQRLIHQLYMDRTAMILLLFDADKEDVLTGLRDWQNALRRSVDPGTPQLLVAGRIDAGFKASRSKLRNFADENAFDYHETSAKDGTGCPQLSAAITNGIRWDQIEKRTSPRIFKIIKDEILRLRDQGEVLFTFKELREVLWRILPNESRFTDDTLQTVIDLLDGPGALKELSYGTYILLQPEWINTYAQAVIRTLRLSHFELGYLPLQSIAEGKLNFESIGHDGALVEMQRLRPAEERIVLQEMERQLQDRGLCLRQGDKLVFPSHCGRDRPEVTDHPSVFVSYAVQGYLDDIYATLVVKLADSDSFKLKELWRDAADFETLAGGFRMGVKLSRDNICSAEISVYFGPGVSVQEQVIFSNYIDAHLESHSEESRRLRHYVCPYCHTPKGNQNVLMQKLMDQRERARVFCDRCDKPFNLWDDLEKRFASREVRERVIGLMVAAEHKLDTRRKGKLLTLEVGSRITSANQKCFEIPSTEDEGIDMELEFTNDAGKGTGKRLYLQLKAGNSYLRKRKSDGKEIFEIKEPRWIEYWLSQTTPVMLVIGTFPTQQKLAESENKLEFEDVRWMEISSYLRQRCADSANTIKHIEFAGERLDILSIRKWRSRILDSDDLSKV